MKNENIFLKPNQTFRVLTMDETLKGDDLIRHRYEDNVPWKDYGWDTTWRGQDWMGTAWHKVKAELPGWVNRTYKAFLMSYYKSKTDLIPIHEIIRIEN